jgi:hypothetical protein
MRSDRMSDITSKPTTDAYRENYDRIFCRHEWGGIRPLRYWDGWEVHSRCSKCGSAHHEFVPAETARRDA